MTMSIYVGVDWAEAHHDVAVKDQSGKTLTKRRLPDGIEGVGRFHQLVADLVEDPSQVIVGIENDRGLRVAALVAAGYQMYAINPFSVSRYRDRHTTSGAKSDPGDAEVLADLVRTDRHAHRPIAGDTELAEAIKVLARAHQSMIWTRQRQVNTLRSALREFYPAALAAFADLDAAEALAILARAPDPQTGRGLSRPAIGAALRRGGRQRGIEERAAQIQSALRTDQLAAPPLLASAYAASVAATVAILTELNRQIRTLETSLADHFEQHPDAEIIRSLPGLGMVLGARVLGEFGDDPNRYADPKSRKNYAGTSPVTKASGTRRVVLARHVRNRRLADATYLWAFSSLTSSPGARDLYDRHRAKGDTHHQALRAVGNRLVGILHGCLRTRTLYNEATAWPTRLNLAA
jgi:transposase